jgi:hypothetical protein
MCTTHVALCTQTHFRVLKGGSMRAVTEAYYPSDLTHHYGIVLQDAIEVSQHLLAWVRLSILAYQYGAASDFVPDLYGIR